MEDTRTKNTIRNIFTGLINKIIMLFFPFIIRTLLIKNLGSEYLGLSSLFSSILQVLNLSELGFSSAIIFCMYKPMAEKDKDKICALLNFYKKTYRIIGIIILSIGIILLPFLPNLIHGTYPETINIYLLYSIYLINTSITYFLFAYKSALLIAQQRNDVVSNINTIICLIQYIIQIAIICVLKNYYLYVLVQFFMNVINNILIDIVSRKRYPEYQCKGNIDSKEKKEIGKKIYGLLLQKISSVTRNSFDSIFISAFMGLNVVAIYNNYYYILNAVAGLLTIVATSMSASVGNTIITESKETNFDNMMKFDFIYMWIVGICSISLICLYQPFMKIWMGNEYLFSFNTVICFCIYFYTLKMGDIRGIYYSATGLWYQGKYRAVAESILNVFLNLILGKIFGVKGIIIATEISLFLINFIYGSTIIFKYYFKNNKLIEYFKYHCIYIIATLVCAFITYNVSECIKADGIIKLLLTALICITLPNAYYLIIYRNNKYYNLSKKFVLEKVLKVKGG